MRSVLRTVRQAQRDSCGWHEAGLGKRTQQETGPVLAESDFCSICTFLTWHVSSWQLLRMFIFFELIYFLFDV